MLPSTPSPPAVIINAPVSLLDALVLFVTSKTASAITLLFDESRTKSPVVVLIVVPAVNPSVRLFALMLLVTLS